MPAGTSSNAAVKPNSRHDVDDSALSKYIAYNDAVPGLRVPVKTTKIGHGQSNPTYFMDDALGKRYILRKKPIGTIISPVAHQIDREFRVLKALGSVKDFPVPKVFCLCTDETIIGTKFYIMEFVKGRIITDMNLGELSPADRRKAWFSCIETLAWLHSLNPNEIGLQGYGKEEGFYTRHCKTFSRIEAQQAAVLDSKTGQKLGRAHVDYDEVVDYVQRNVPGERSSIVHGDFKFDNLVLHPKEPIIIAILDWELSTVGHPLMDVIFTTSPFWNEHGKVGQTASEFLQSPFRPDNSAQSGMPALQELLDRYAKIVGYDMREDGGGKDIEVAKIFNHLRGATISHGIQARTICGQASSEQSHVFFEHTKKSLDTAINSVRELKAAERVQAKL